MLYTDAGAAGATLVHQLRHPLKLISYTSSSSVGVAAGNNEGPSLPLFQGLLCHFRWLARRSACTLTTLDIVGFTT